MSRHGLYLVFCRVKIGEQFEHSRKFVASQRILGELHSQLFEQGMAGNMLALRLGVGEGASERSALVPVIENVTARYGFGVHRSNPEYIVETRVQRMILNASQGAFNRSPSAAKSSQPARFRDDPVVSRYDKVSV